MQAFKSFGSMLSILCVWNDEDLIKPLKQTANLTGMAFVPPIYPYSMVYIPGVYNEKEIIPAYAAMCIQ